MEITGNPEPKGSRGPRASATPRCVLASSWEEIPLEKDQTISVGCLAQQPRRGALLLWSLHLRKITTVILWKETEVPRCFHYCFFLKEERSRVLILKAPQLFRAFGLAALTKSQGSLVSPFILIKVELKKKKTTIACQPVNFSHCEEFHIQPPCSGGSEFNFLSVWISCFLSSSSCFYSSPSAGGGIRADAQLGTDHFSSYPSVGASQAAARHCWWFSVLNISTERD